MLNMSKSGARRKGQLSVAREKRTIVRFDTVQQWLAPLRFASRAMTVAIVVNAKGGTAMGMERDELETTFADAFGDGAEVTIVEGAGLPDAMKEAFTRADVGRVVVAGGDGTVSLAGKWAVETGKPFGVVPLGTMNLFARTIGMPLDADDAIRGLSTAVVRHVDCAEANGETFVNHVSFGFHPQLVRMRDAIPRGSRLKRMWNGLRVYLRLVSRHRKHRLTLTGDFAPFGAKAGLAVVSINPIKEGVAQIPRPDGQRDGQLGVYVSTHKSAWDLNKVIWRLMNGTLTESEHVEFRETSEVTIEARKALHMSMDGEVFVANPPIHCRIRRRKMAVLVPPGTPLAPEVTVGEAIAANERPTGERDEPPPDPDHADARSIETNGHLAESLEAR